MPASGNKNTKKRNVCTLPYSGWRFFKLKIVLLIEFNLLVCMCLVILRHNFIKKTQICDDAEIYSLFKHLYLDHLYLSNVYW